MTEKQKWRLADPSKIKDFSCVSYIKPTGF